MRRTLLAAALVLSMASAALAAEPRVVVGHVADQIAANYFDPAKGAAIAADLKAEAAKGAYDRYADPLDLSRALTERLRPLDGHFGVSWTPPAPAAGQPGPRRPPVDDALSDRRNNYGFRGARLLPGNVALIDLGYFADFSGPDDPARATADAALALIARADAVIFDVRDNGGGSPAMVGYLVSHFVPAGADVYNTFKGRGPDEYEKPIVEVRGARMLTAPLYVLTSARTGSAAESFAYTLQAAKRAVIVGEASAGAANPGGPAAAGDGFSVFVSNGRPVNPITKANWEGTGVLPDVVVPTAEAPAKAQALALTRVLAAGLAEPFATEDRWVLEALASPPVIPTATLAGYAGAYGNRNLAVEDGRLVLRQGRRPPLTLRPLSADLFAVEAPYPSRIRFERDAGGKLTGFVQLIPDGQMFRYARTG